jgi:hypothetical protein
MGPVDNRIKILTESEINELYSAPTFSSADQDFILIWTTLNAVDMIRFKLFRQDYITFCYWDISEESR